MKEEKNFDIFGYVRGMRYKRNCMVQTEVSQIPQSSLYVILNITVYYYTASVCVHS